MIKKQRFLPEEYASQIDTEKFGTNGTVFRKVKLEWCVSSEFVQRPDSGFRSVLDRDFTAGQKRNHNHNGTFCLIFLLPQKQFSAILVICFSEKLGEKFRRTEKGLQQ